MENKDMEAIITATTNAAMQAAEKVAAAQGKTNDTLFGKIDSLQKTANDNQRNIAVMNTNLENMHTEITRIGSPCPICKDVRDDIDELKKFKQTVSTTKTVLFVFIGFIGAMLTLTLYFLMVIKK
jgi:hypothetical protein